MYNYIDIFFSLCLSIAILSQTPDSNTYLIVSKFKNYRYPDKSCSN